MMRKSRRSNKHTETDNVTDHIAEQSKLTSMNLFGFILNELAHYNNTFHYTEFH